MHSSTYVFQSAAIFGFSYYSICYLTSSMPKDSATTIKSSTETVNSFIWNLSQLPHDLIIGLNVSQCKESHIRKHQILGSGECIDRYNYVVAENGLIVNKDDGLLAIQSSLKHIGEEKLYNHLIARLKSRNNTLQQFRMS